MPDPDLTTSLQLPVGLLPCTLSTFSLLHFLQLASPALPVGAYSYSEGIETLVETHRIRDGETLKHWLMQELKDGAIRLEAAVLLRGYRAMQAGDWEQLNAWNYWLSAVRETEELRSQSWQMGRSLLRLLQDLQVIEEQSVAPLQQPGCNFAIAFAIGAVHWQIDCEIAILGYLHSWVTNLINAGIKLIPLGQTAGQQLLISLYPTLEGAMATILQLDDDELDSCSWGLTLASMTHEQQYSRLFRS